MSQTKAQLIQPIGVVTASGVVVSGVMTAATFDGDIVGSATSIIQGTNLNLGAFNATSFAGDFTGNATGIITSSAIKVGQLTASSFVGDFTGTATSMARGTGFEAGAVTGSAFVADVTGNVTGNATGLAGSVTQGTNIHVGVVTATSYYGDGSNLTGIAATNFNTQTVTANGAATTIDLSAGNVITFNQSANTTVSFANTSEAMDITLIRNKDDTTTARTITWPSSVKWNGGSAPTLISKSIAGDSQQFQFLTRDSGLTWYAWEPYHRDIPTYSLFSWGNQDGKGALGQNNNTPQSSPMQIGTDVTWTTASVGTYYGSGGIKADGTLWTWGNNQQGNLAQNNKTSYSSPKQVGTDTNWASVNIDSTCFGVKTDGTLWVWGSNNQGNLGLNASIYAHKSSPTQIPGTTWTNLGRSGWSTRDAFVAKTDGSLWAWGNNEDGALGINDTTDRSSPCQIGTGTDWSTSIRPSKGFYGKAGGALKTDGSLFTWGANDYGLLGQNEAPSPNYSSPIQVPGTWAGIFYNWEHVMGLKDE